MTHDLHTDMKWFRKHIEEYEELSRVLDLRWAELARADRLPAISDRMPKDLQEVTPYLQKITDKFKDSMAEGVQAMGDMAQGLHATAEEYVRNENLGVEESDAILKELDA